MRVNARSSCEVKLKLSTAGSKPVHVIGKTHYHSQPCMPPETNMDANLVVVKGLLMKSQVLP